VLAPAVAAKVVAVAWAAAAALGIAAADAVVVAAAALAVFAATFAAASTVCGVVFVAAVEAAEDGFADGRESMARRCHAGCRVSLDQTQPSPSPYRRWVLRLCGFQAPRQVVGLRVGLDP
jgi:hypothetical protein